MAGDCMKLGGAHANVRNSEALEKKCWNNCSLHICFCGFTRQINALISRVLCLKIVKCKERPYGCWHGCLLNCLYCPVWQGERVWRLGPTLRHWQNIVMAQLIELDLPCTYTHDFSVLLVNWIITVCYWQAFTFFCFVISLSVRAACARRSSVFVDIATLQFFG